MNLLIKSRNTLLKETYNVVGHTNFYSMYLLLTNAAYAHHFGVSRQTVYDWVVKGEAVISSSKIDVEATKQMQHGNDRSGGNG